MKQNSEVNYKFILLIIFTFLLSISASWCQAEEIEFTFQNSFDKTEQLAIAYVPEICKTKENGGAAG